MVILIVRIRFCVNKTLSVVTLLVLQPQPKNIVSACYKGVALFPCSRACPLYIRAHDEPYNEEI